MTTTTDVCVLVMTDGRRECIGRALDSAVEHLQGNLTKWVIHDDSGDTDYRSWLNDQWGDFAELIGAPTRQGFGGAYASAWRYATANVAEPFIFSTEDDFTYNRAVDLDALACVLDANQELVQLALRRQPWNEQERAAGGVIEQFPDSFTEQVHGAHRWLEHRRWFTTNPSLFRRSLCAEGWPEGAESEGRFGIGLLERHPTWRFGYWGGRDSGEWVQHIGHERVGVGY